MDKVQELRDFYANMDGKDAFELLGVARDADDEAVRQSYSKLLKLYHSDRFALEADSELDAILAKLHTRLREAYDAIANVDKREIYLRMGDDVHQEVDLGAIFALEKVHDHGMALFERGEYGLALPKLEQAQGLTPDDPSLMAMISFCRYMLASLDRAGKRPKNDVSKWVAQLERLAENNKRDVEARLFLGLIMKLEGNMTAAQRYFRAVDEMTHSSNAVASRELRLIQDRQRKAAELNESSPFLKKIKSLFGK